jgi:tRNA(Ile)-lysidine synthase
VLELERGWQLQAEEIQNPITIDLQSRTNQDPFQAWLDLSGVDLPLVARSRHPGDKIRLLGLNGHATKISDLMINIKLPKRARLTWPLICSGQEVLWVPGYRLSHLVRIKPETVKAVHLSLTCRQTA